MKSFSLSIPTYNSHSTTPGCCCFKIHGNKKRVFKSDLWAFWTCVFYNKIISKQDFQIVEFTLSTLVKMLPSTSYCFANDSSTSSPEQSSASSPPPVPVCGESSRIRHSIPLSAISSGSNSDSNYPSAGLTTLIASVCSSGGSSLSSISTVSPIVSPWTHLVAK